MKKTLIITSSGENNILGVMEHLTTDSVIRVDIDTLFAEGVVSFRIANGLNIWRITLPDGSITSDDVQSIWYRRPPHPVVPEAVADHSREFAINESKHFLWSLWTNTLNVTWVNHPHTSRLLEFNKPYQLRVAEVAGLAIPDTLITTSVDEALAFADMHGDSIVVKAFGGTDLFDNAGNRLGIYTNRIGRKQIEQNRDGFALAPVMLESYIPKRLELRVTIVGKRIFSCAIYSQDSPKTRDDWRHYDFDQVRHEQMDLPQNVADRLLEFMTALGLNFGAVDMVLTPDGEYVFLEVNPSGQWGWIECITGMPISKAIAELLEQPSKFALV